MIKATDDESSRRWDCRCRQSERIIMRFVEKWTGWRIKKRRSMNLIVLSDMKDFLSYFFLTSRKWRRFALTTSNNVHSERVESFELFRCFRQTIIGLYRLDCTGISVTLQQLNYQARVWRHAPKYFDKQSQLEDSRLFVCSNRVNRVRLRLIYAAIRFGQQQLECGRFSRIVAARGALEFDEANSIPMALELFSISDCVQTCSDCRRAWTHAVELWR